MLSPWLWGLAIAGIAAAAAGAAHDIQGFVEGKTPWDDTSEWITSGLKQGGIAFGASALGGAAGAALGPAAGAGAGATGGVGGGAAGAGAGGAAGSATGSSFGVLAGDIGPAIGDLTASFLSNAGTAAAEAGAATPATVAGVIPKEAGSLLSAGTQGGEGAIREALGKVAGNTFGGAVGGAAQDPQNPGRGALMGAAGSLASAGVSGLARNVAPVFRGQGAGIVNTGAGRASMMPSLGSEITYQPTTSAHYSLGAPSAPQIGGAPSFGERAFGMASRAGSKFAGKAASQMVGSSLTPGPPDPMAQNPYANTPYRQANPYWMNYGMR